MWKVLKDLKIVFSAFAFLHKLACTLQQNETPIDQFRYIKIQSKTSGLSTRLVEINPTDSVVIPTSLVLRSIVLD